MTIQALARKLTRRSVTIFAKKPLSVSNVRFQNYSSSHGNKHEESCVVNSKLKSHDRILGFTLLGVGLVLTDLLYRWYENFSSENNNKTKTSETQKSYRLNKSGKSFADVIGRKDILAEIKIILQMLDNPDRSQLMGAQIPKSILIKGYKGCGKTFLATAIAGETDIPVFFISSSELAAKDGTTKIETIFNQAKKSRNAIIFIDDVDIIANRDNLLQMNTLLTKMQEISSSEKIVVMATMNGIIKQATIVTHADLECFSWKLVLTPLSKEDQENLIRYHLKNVPHEKMDSKKILESVPPNSNAGLLANIVNHATIKAYAENRSLVTPSDLKSASDKLTRGVMLKSFKRSEKALRRTAVHEAGHALLRHIFHKDGVCEMKVRKATISPQSYTLGLTQFQGPEEQTASLKYYRASLIAVFGGRAAEALIYGEDNINDGCMTDLKNAEGLAQKIVSLISCLHENTTVLMEFKKGYKQAKKLLNENSENVVLIADALMKFKTLDGAEIEEIIETKSFKGVEEKRATNDS